MSGKAGPSAVFLVFVGRGGNGHGLFCARISLCHHIDPQHDSADAWAADCFQKSAVTICLSACHGSPKGQFSNDLRMVGVARKRLDKWQKDAERRAGRCASTAHESIPMDSVIIWGYMGHEFPNFLPVSGSWLISQLPQQFCAGDLFFFRKI